METGGVGALVLASAFPGRYRAGRAKMHLILILGLMCLVSGAKREPRSFTSSTEKNPTDFTIGGVLSSDQSIHYFKETIEVKYML